MKKTGYVIARLTAAVIAVLLAAACAIPALADDVVDPNSPPTAEGCTSVYLYNFENDRVLYERDTEAAVYPASTVKLMTGILAAETLGGDLDQKITVTDEMLALRAGNNIGLVAGEIVTARAKARGVRFRPVDSEHSAIFQALQGGGTVERLILTASGGPFLDGPEDLSSVTVEQALNHPRWKMGPKVTVDSATMMNKGFEVIEARWLFDVPAERIDVVVHPESVVHSLVTFTDGSTLAQLSPPDMRVPIQYALSWPERLPAVRRTLDLPALGALTFRAPDPARFPCLTLVREALRRGGLAPAALSVADEFAVREFLEGRIRYVDIPDLLEKAIAAPERWLPDGLDI